MPCSVATRRGALLCLAILAIAVFAPRAFALPGDTPPQRLIIPAIGVDAAVESVGLNADGAMGSPKGWANVGWYNLGVAPGRQGNAVMAGHLDDRNGDPAVFWDLDNLKPGDEVLVVDGQGATQRFQVSEVASYRTGTTPMKYVFGVTSATRLNLVTCGGTWNQDVHLYSHRLVVFADLVGAGGAVPPPQGAPAQPAEVAPESAESSSEAGAGDEPGEVSAEPAAGTHRRSGIWTARPPLGRLSDVPPVY